MTDENLRVLSEETPEKIRENSRFSALGKLIGAALDDFAEGRPLVGFERLADGAALSSLKKERYEAEGVQPFVRYCFYKQDRKKCR